MSHHQPPQPQANLYGFGDHMQGGQPPNQQDDDAMMSLLGYNPAFDSSMQMALDDDANALMSAQTFQRPLAPAAIAATPAPAPVVSAPAASDLRRVVIPVTGTSGGPTDAEGLLGSMDGIATGQAPSASPASQQASAKSGFAAPLQKQPQQPQQQLPGPAAGGGGGGGGSTLTDYTKKRDWAARTVEELADLQQILDENGRVRHVSQSVTALTGYTKEEMLDAFLRDLIHPDDVGIFVSELNESIATGNTMRFYYRMRKKDGTYGIFESVGHGHIAPAKFAPNPHNKSHFCQAVFLISRPYPTKNAVLLDSFLEHKIENERLRRRIHELRKEEYEDGGEDSQRQWPASLEGRSDIMSEDATVTASASATPRHPGHAHAPHNEGIPLSGGGGAAAALDGKLTRENLEGSVRQDSIKDKMARYEGTSHADTIEMLTGLRYQDGERSHGVTPGNTSPILTKGDAGIAIPLDRDPRASADKKKKLKVAEEYVCTDCGTLDSPEWRKGPSGPKTLCNACGLRWAKKEKKKNVRNGTGTATSMTVADY
ncbi:white collar 2 [Gaeumannomyces tritici R3-111a-1]|uniref:White collar 2 n=1 Tax=Gaeumannomyces tritici (strain R3-111a-1) TaxID=644352 RepID=J3P9C3_GAET3|nr:white collar 2 [Gaeumannomyces tritici R3-111a-1]EJT73259.1 white collar 2 [Gaeumannomyces tritici R3-111a-1]